MCAFRHKFSSLNRNYTIEKALFLFWKSSGF
jgi:hypothetical protein